jgi:hypothetical protein
MSERPSFFSELKRRNVIRTRCRVRRQRGCPAGVEVWFGQREWVDVMLSYFAFGQTIC